MEKAINDTLKFMMEEIEAGRERLLQLNAKDVANCDRSDISLYDRLSIDEKKVDGMISSLKKVLQKDFPFKSLYSFEHDNGLQIENRSVPFGTILIIYESRPDVTVEATAIALKSGNKILLKGGKEAKESNAFLHNCWSNALKKAGLNESRVRYLHFNRTELQAWLKEPDTPLDLIIPRGGERLIEYVQSVAQCPVLVSGRGNNFLYVSENADLTMAKKIIVESKISKISACNALDKVLIHQSIPETFVSDLSTDLKDKGVEIVVAETEEKWKEEFLDMKIVLSRTNDLDEAMDFINKYSGKHSATIISNETQEADTFMQNVDCAAVYHNASTRFTDGFEFGLGAEMAISTTKLHHRGPLGIEHLVTNKWYIKGNGQSR